MANSSSIENAGTGDAVTGTFLGLAEGAQIANFLGSGRSATLSYIGGDGHDVTLTGHGLFVSLDGAGNLVLTYNAGMDDAVTIQAAPATVESVITHAIELIGNQVAPFTGTGTMVARVPFTAVTETQISANVRRRQRCLDLQQGRVSQRLQRRGLSQPRQFTVRRPGGTLNNLVKSVFRDRRKWLHSDIRNRLLIDVVTIESMPVSPPR